MGREILELAISSRRLARTYGVVMMYSRVARTAVAVVSPPAKLGRKSKQILTCIRAVLHICSNDSDSASF